MTHVVSHLLAPRVETLEEGVIDIRATVDGHTGLLNRIMDILERHSETLDRHSRTLDEHTVRLDYLESMMEAGFARMDRGFAEQRELIMRLF